MDVELPEPNRWVRVIGDNGDDCAAPQWVLPWGEVITVFTFTDGVEIGEHFHEDLPALRASTLATLAAIDRAGHLDRRVAREDVTLK